MSVPQGRVKDTHLLIPLEVDASGVVSKRVQVTDFDSMVYGTVNDLALGAGANTILSPAVPADTIWRITYFSAYYSGTVAGLNLTYLIQDEVPLYFDTLVTVPNNIMVGNPIELYLSAGQKIGVFCYPATAGDDMYFYWFGYAFAAP